jgi:hypothetical protein
MALGEGGGICNQGTSTLMMTDCTINNNSSGTRGGGLFNYDTATLTDVTVSGNSALQLGGALINYGGTLTLAGCTISGNSSEDGGGLANVEGGQITLNECTVSDNFASGNGGGAIGDQGTLALTNCTVSGNSAGGSGGALCNGTDSPVFVVSGVTAASGHGVGQAETPTISLTNCTVSGNTGYGGDGGVVNYGTLTLTNTIVAGNSGGDVGGSFTGSHNLIGGNPMLSALGDYGGPSATMALLPGSPAIGGGTSAGAPTLDQRGEPRSGHVDIGAFQSQGFSLTPVAGSSSQLTPINQPFPNPLAFTVKANNPIEPVDGGVVTFSVLPAGGASASLSATTVPVAGGVASVTATANNSMGTYVVSAAAGDGDPNGLVLTNTKAPSLVVTTALDSVGNTDSFTSLREAVAYANALAGPSTITFDPAFFGARRRIIRLTSGPLLITNPATITIVGPRARLLTITGAGKSGVFDVEGGSLALSGVTIGNGNAELGGGVRNDGGRLVLSNVLIQGNRALVGGGLFNDGRTTLRGVLIKGNVAHVGRGMFNTRTASLTWRP